FTSSPTVAPFFFQAEDGIRDFHVTGVQTCALPISEQPGDAESAAGAQHLPPRREWPKWILAHDGSPFCSARSGSDLITARRRPRLCPGDGRPLAILRRRLAFRNCFAARAQRPLPRTPDRST